MKTIYIPKGETVCYDQLATERIVVRGCLKVLGDIHARNISGGGVICAGGVFADDIRLDDLEAASVTCKRLLAKRVHTPRLIASESAAVSCYLTAAYVEAGKLTVAASEVGELKVEEAVNLPVKKRNLFTLLLASALRSLWLSLTAPAFTPEAVDAAFVPVINFPQEAEENAGRPRAA